MCEEDVCLCVLLLVIILWICIRKKSGFILRDLRKEGFAIDEKPFEVENSLLANSPADNLDYIRPKLMKSLYYKPGNIQNINLRVGLNTVVPGNKSMDALRSDLD